MPRVRCVRGNDIVFARGRDGGTMWASSPTEGYKRYGKTGRRGNRRSAASGGRSELISRKCPDWRPQQWPGIGWHDGGQPPPPTGGARGAVGGRPQGSPLRKRYKGGRGERNPPVTASPCQPPLGKGALRTGGTNCHSRCAHRLRNDRLQELRSVVGGGVRAPRPTHFMGCGARPGGSSGRPTPTGA